MAANWSAKAVFTGASLVLLRLTLAAGLRSTDCELDGLFVRSVELANGATWPEKWHELCVHNPGSFALLVAARTVLNFAAPLVVSVTGIWVVTGGLERLMEMTRTQLMQQLAIELVVSLHALVRRNHPETPQDKLLEELQQMRAVANTVVDDFVRDTEQQEARRRRHAAVR